MNKLIRSIAITSITLASLAVLGSSVVLAQSFDFSELDRLINQNNNFNGINQVNTECGTGGNSVNGGGSVSTGNCGASTNVQNNVNSNQAETDCCPKPTPTPSPVPSPTSPPPPPSGGGDGCTTNCGGGNGNGGGSSSSESAPQVLGSTGIATTGLLYLFGSLLIVTGIKFSSRFQSSV